MAKINETVFVVKVSELLKDDQQETAVFDEETLVQLYQVLQELAGPGKLVELIQET